MNKLEEIKSAFYRLRRRYYYELVFPRAEYKCGLCKETSVECLTKYKVVFLDFNELNFDHNNLKIMCPKCFKAYTEKEFVNQSEKRQKEIREIWQKSPF